MIRKLFAAILVASIPLAALACSVDVDEGGDDDCTTVCVKDRDSCVTGCDDDGDCVKVCEDVKGKCVTACE